MKEFFIIINPASSSGKNREKVGEFTQWVSDHLPEARVEFTRHKNHAIKLASLAAKGGYSKIISVGGDGTLNEVVNGVIPHPPESRPAIGIVSAGTGGDFFRLLSQKYHFPSEFSWLTHTDAKLVDAGKVTLESQEGSPFQRYFINIADAGLSGEVERRVNASKKLLGSLQYLVSGLIAAIFYRPPQVKWAGIDWEGSPPPTVFPLLLAVVANGKYFGGGMCIAPQSEPDDQSFQIMVAEKLKYLSMLRQIPHMYRKEKFRHRKIHYGVGQKVVLEALSGEIPVGIDGESFLASRATFEVVPNALKILVPTG